MWHRDRGGATMRSMRLWSTSRRAGQGERSSRRDSRGRSTRWAAAFGLLVSLLGLVLGAAATFVDKQASPWWLWVTLFVAGTLVGAAAKLLDSQWWRDRQAPRVAERERVARLAQAEKQDRRGHFEPRGRGVLPFRGRRGWYFTAVRKRCGS
jgi:hypothetical protein